MTGVGPTLALIAAVVLVPSATMAIFAAWVGYGQALVNLDLIAVYGVVGVLARRWRRAAIVAGAMLVTLIVAVAVMRSLGMVYILDPALMLGYLGFVEDWPWRHILLTGAAFAAVPLAMAATLKRLRCERASLWAVPVLLVLALATDVLLGSSRFGGQGLRTRVNIATSSAWQAWVIGWQWAHTPAFRIHGRTGLSMHDDLQGQSRPARILSVAVESWGVVKGEPLADAAIIAPLRDRLRGRFEIHVEQHPYRGGTIAGELRELCGLLVTGVPSVPEVQRLLGERCLPGQLRRLGYDTWAAHANVGRFYNRDLLYPALGFGETLFGPDLRAEVSPCPATLFEGPCDREVIRRALRWLSNRPRGFAHTITLETHLPLQARAPGEMRCPEGVELQPALCLYINRLASALDEIGQSLAESAPGPEVVYIYGDHAPPYASVALRDRFDRTSVPAIRLIRAR